VRNLEQFDEGKFLTAANSPFHGTYPLRKNLLLAAN